MRRAELEEFLGSLDPSLPTLVAGDFNEGTSGDALELPEAKGLRTALPEFHRKAKTWHWPVAGSLELTGQLDHVAYGVELEPVDASVQHAGNSDHFPVTVTFVAAAKHAVRPPPPSGASVSLGSVR